MGQVLIPDGDLQVVTHITQDQSSHPVLNGFGIKYDTTADMADVSDALQIAFVGWAAQFTPHYLTTHISVRIGSAAPPYASFDIPINVVGDGAAEALPPSVAVLVKLTTAEIGRGNRGRLYLSGVCDEGDVDSGGNLDPSCIATTQGFVEDLYVLLQSAPLEGWVLLHSEGSPLGGIANQISSATVQSVCATQRRRMR